MSSKMRMSGLCKVEMSAFMGGRGPHGNGANRLESTRTGPAARATRGQAEADQADRSRQGSNAAPLQWAKKGTIPSRSGQVPFVPVQGDRKGRKGVAPTWRARIIVPLRGVRDA